jgi:hypothetical protein
MRVWWRAARRFEQMPNCGSLWDGTYVEESEWLGKMEVPLIHVISWDDRESSRE